jgi:very-short-patch-repair endonuclease
MPESALEATFAYWWDLLVVPDWPAPEREYLFNAPHTRHRFDFAWPQRKVAVEVDGGTWLRGGGRHNADSDRNKLNIAASLGYRVLRFSGDMLTRDPQRCIDQTVKALEYSSAVLAKG